jgi:hypothetical protein
MMVVNESINVVLYSTDVVLSYAIDNDGVTKESLAEYERIGFLLGEGYRLLDVISVSGGHTALGRSGFVAVTVALTKSKVPEPYLAGQGVMTR